ncbi:RecX family transcriptional regulator [Candidatus Saccharibacteria bacterium]|nr:RecX family transcriptional regulator [Candidatus Saccharibacteria bacterium]
MEIYKLTDSVSDRVSGKYDEKLIVTDLRQGIKNPNRVNVFVNGRFSFSLDVSQVVEMGVKKGREIDREQLGEFKKASEFGKLYQRTLEWTLLRPHSEREIYDYLKKKIYDKKLDKDLIERIIDRLKEKGYIDDEKFAQYYIENRFVKKGISRKRLKMELKKKGVNETLAEMVLGERSDVDEIKKIVQRKQKKYDKEKLIAYLCRQGFSYELVKEVVEEELRDYSSSASDGL